MKQRIKPVIFVLSSSLFLLYCSDDSSSEGDAGTPIKGDTGSSDSNATDSNATDVYDNDPSDNNSDSPTDDQASNLDAGREFCDEQSFEIAQLPVNVMILQDISTSMEEPENEPVNKWQQAREALKLLLAEWKGQNITFGFDAFPDGSQDEPNPLKQCGVAADLLFDCEPDNEDQIIATLDTLSPLGATPLWCELNQFMGDTYAPVFATKAVGEKYLLVVSDGEDTCGEDCEYLPRATTNALEELTASLLTEKKIKTIVIGFGDELEGAERQLEAIAKAGGSPFSSYLPAENQDELYEAFSVIAGAVLSCSFEFSDPDASADPSKVNLYFDDNVVGYDEGCTSGEGWFWSGTSNDNKIELCPKACEKVKAGEVKTVTAKFGCNTEIIDLV